MPLEDYKCQSSSKCITTVRPGFEREMGMEVVSVEEELMCGIVAVHTFY
jgi:hypothetical protein